jgi:amino acid transporter
MADLVKREGSGSAAETPPPSAEAAGASTLRRNALSMPEVLAQSVANMAPTAAMALLPLLVFVSAGNGTWLSFVIATVLMVCVGYCASQFARRMNSAGSFYVWVTRGLGSGTGHTSGWALQLGYICTGMATVRLLGQLAPPVHPGRSLPLAGGSPGRAALRVLRVGRGRPDLVRRSPLQPATRGQAGGHALRDRRRPLGVLFPCGGGLYVLPPPRARGGRTTGLVLEHGYRFDFNQ